METYMNIEELAKYLGVAEKTIRKWVLNRQIPFHKIMKVIRFRVSEIERWIDEDSWKYGTEDTESAEAGLPRDVISLEELVEEELADEMPDNGGDE